MELMEKKEVLNLKNNKNFRNNQDKCEIIMLKMN